jgi:single-stranded-DNA-specific exonuclease
MFGKSCLSYTWELLPIDEVKSRAFSQKFGLSGGVADILSSNSQLTIETLENFLKPSVRALLPNPLNAFLDMEVAVLRVLSAIRNKENIVIFGDYDVDGATSSAILKRFFQMIGMKSTIYIPDRIREGYGPNTNALLSLKKDGADLVITVDCGTVSFEPLEEAKMAGLDIIVIDHHLGVKEKPASIAVINPNRYDETSDLTYLCGAGVTFMMIVALNMKLKEEQYYLKQKISEPSLITLLDLVALGTVCDVMPLVGLNRAFVKTGISVMKEKQNIGIASLLAIAGMEREITEYTLGFIIGPRINAGGRIGKSDLGARLLSTHDKIEAMKLAEELHDLNAKRKEIEEEMLFSAFVKIEQEKKHEKGFIFISSPDYHQGVIGILASRIKDRYNKPAAVFSVTNDIGKASLRSINGIDLGAIIHKANAKGILIAGGGHAMAGGLSIKMEKIKELEDFFEAELGEEALKISSQKMLFLSARVTIAGINLELFHSLEALSPFGPSNPKPIFLIQNAVVVKTDILKDKHISFILKDKNSSKTLKAMFFKAFDIGIGQTLMKLLGKEISAAGELVLNEWNGNQTVQFNLIDISY